MQLNFKKMHTIWMVLILIGMPFTTALTAPINENIILTFGNSSEETLAIDTIVENNINTHVLNYDDPLSLLKLRRNIGNVFVVGHGNVDGLKTEEGIIPYSYVNSIVSHSSGQAAIYVACNSYEAAKELTFDNKFGFPGEIEPKTGALIASYLVGSEKVELFDVIDRVVEVGMNPEAYSTLYFGSVEQVGHVSAILTILALTIMTATAAVSASLMESAVIKYISSLGTWASRSLIAMLTTSFVIAYTERDYGDMLSIVGNLFSHLVEVVLVAVAIAPWWLAAAIAVAAATDIALNTLTNVAKVAIIFSISAVIFAAQLYHLDKDKADADDYYYN